jgi:serine/threonine-protein kinase
MVKLLGSGAAAEIYKARREGESEALAVKVMWPHVAAKAEHVARFRREARAARKITHPNVLRVHELVEDTRRGLFFIVMELLQGESVDAWLKRQSGVPSLDDVAAIMIPLLDAFETAHGLGLVHRDLKPENVFLVGERPQWVIKVLDFGLARITGDTGGTVTGPDMIVGTPQYMSPEQCQGLRVGPESDMYALGCVLTELLQGSPPFDKAPVMEILAKHLFVPPPALARPDGAEPVPPALDELRRALLAKAPADRPGIAETRRRFQQALGRWPARPA